MIEAVLSHARHTRLLQIWQRLLEVFEVSVEYHYAAPWKSTNRRPASIHFDARG